MHWVGWELGWGVDVVIGIERQRTVGWCTFIHSQQEFPTIPVIRNMMVGLGTQRLESNLLVDCFVDIHFRAQLFKTNDVFS